MSTHLFIFGQKEVTLSRSHHIKSVPHKGAMDRFHRLSVQPHPSPILGSHGEGRRKEGIGQSAFKAGVFWASFSKACAI